MAATREIRRRVKAVKNIRQITRAMELVSAAKMQRAVAAVQQSRRYAELAWETLSAVTKKFDARHHPLLAARPRHRLLLVLVSSNRGLAGGLNAKLGEAVRDYMAVARERTPGLVIETVSAGKKGREYLQKIGAPIVADFTFSDRAQAVDEVLPLARLILDDYQVGKYDAVAIAYTHFVSMLRQEPRVREILPLTSEVTALAESDLEESGTVVDEQFNEYLFEPDPAVVLQMLVPRLLETQLYQAIVESRAAEHAARMTAMRNATEAAGDLISDLTLTYNQLRQSSITQELAEISAGRLALGL